MMALEQDVIFEENKILAPFTTFKIGGPARYLCEINTCDDFRNALVFCEKKNLSYIILGKGSNTLFDQRGFNGAVLINKMEHFEIHEDGYCLADAGLSLPFLAIRTAKLSWTGLEFGVGIPCSIGGALFMNASANKMSISDPLLWVRFLRSDGRIKIYQKQDLFFSYRYSSFHEMDGLILQAAFSLQHDPLARERQIQMLHKRKETQPYGDCSAGCVFRNPLGQSAGKLIEECGLKKSRIGGAEVSDKHANFIVNKGNASSEDVLQLIVLIKRVVKNEMGIDLLEEVRYVPYTIDH